MAEQQKNQQKAPEGDDIVALKAALDQANADKAALEAQVKAAPSAEDVAKLRADLDQANADKAALEAAKGSAPAGTTTDGPTRIVVAVSTVMLKGKLKEPGSEFELPATDADELIAAGAVLTLEDWEADQAAKAKAKGRPIQR